MLELTRTVRMCLNANGCGDSSPKDNTFSAWPAMRGLGRYYELDITCRGVADAQTGYFINIRDIDAAVRTRVLPELCRQVEADADNTPMGTLMHRIIGLLQDDLRQSVIRAELALTPFLRYAAEVNNMNTVLIKQQYEFSAAHRLHAAGLSDEENKAVFGKCNNPSGHGHNYRVEVAARCNLDDQGRSVCPADLDRAVNTHCIDKLDHKHLNRDVPQFAAQNPSVENITLVIWDMLKDNLPQGAALDEVRVWETGKTVCSYRGV